MCREEWILCLMVTLTLVVACFVLSAPPSKPVILRWPACEDKSKCGECELMLRPDYLLPVCEQRNCKPLRADPPANQLPTPMHIQAILCSGQNQWALYRRKAWSDCNGDDQADCECWTWYWRDKSDPNHWRIGVECEEE